MILVLFNNCFASLQFSQFDKIYGISSNEHILVLFDEKVLYIVDFGKFKPAIHKPFSLHPSYNKG